MLKSAYIIIFSLLICLIFFCLFCIFCLFCLLFVCLFCCCICCLFCCLFLLSDNSVLVYYHNHRVHIYYNTNFHSNLTIFQFYHTQSVSQTQDIFCRKSMECIGQFFGEMHSSHILLNKLMSLCPTSSMKSLTSGHEVPWDLAALHCGSDVTLLRCLCNI